MVNTQNEKLTSLIKEKFRLIDKKANVRSRIHFCIAVGDHDGISKNAKLLKVIEKNIESIDLAISEFDDTQKLQTLL